MKASVLIEEAVSLPVEERARLVECLLQSLNAPDDTHTAAWVAVARRRLGELTDGAVEPVSGAAVFERVQARYGR